jgi:hypothetical protein
MRPLEILTFVSLLGSLIALLIIRKGPRWFNYLPGFTLVIVLCHVVFEGVRWQMIPAYVFISVLFLISLKQFIGKKKEQLKRPAVFKRIFRISGTVITFILFVIILILPLEVPMFRIPHPTGKFKVGSSILFFRDTKRIDAYSPDKNRFRELSVRVWYPASSGNQGKRRQFLTI